MDIKKEQQLFKEALLQRGDFKEEEFELNKFGDFSWIGTDDAYGIWELCAESKQAEINELKAKLEAAQVPEGFVLVEKLQLTQLMADMDYMGKKALGSDYVSFADIAKVLDGAIEVAQGEGHDNIE